MPIVTSITPQKNNQKVNVFLDYKFAFGLSLDNLVKYKIKLNKEFTDKEIKKIQSAGKFENIYNKILNFATLRPRSNYEIVSYLRRKKIDEEFHKKLFDKLNNLDLLNDELFAKWWVGQRTAFKPKPKRVLKLELQQKGISREIIDKIFENEEVDEYKIAKELVSKKEKRWSNLEESEKKKKIISFLKMRGFGWEIIKQVIE